MVLRLFASTGIQKAQSQGALRGRQISSFESDCPPPRPPHFTQLTPELHFSSIFHYLSIQERHAAEAMLPGRASLQGMPHIQLFWHVSLNARRAYNQPCRRCHGIHVANTSNGKPGGRRMDGRVSYPFNLSAAFIYKVSLP